MQGSYRNSTNIRGDSDVDVVVEFNSLFYSNKDELSWQQLQDFNECYSDGKYSLTSFTDAVIQRLKCYYGDAYVKVGNNSIKILANSGRLDCDVICCAEYREYRSFSKVATTNYAKGIVFWTNETDEKVVSFPKIHFDNGRLKTQVCNSNYKSTIRIIKNMKAKLVNNGTIKSSLAPSYFIEGFIFNMPDINFKNTSHYARVLAVLNTLYNYSDSQLEELVCQNKQRYLFGNTNQQWSIVDCKTFRDQLIKFWNDFQ